MEQSDEGIVRGVVKWFDLGKGFGFVIADGIPQDILLHVNVVRASGRTGVVAGDGVTIRYDETPKGFQVIELMGVEASEGTEETTQTLEADPSEALLPARLKWFDKGKGYGFVNVFGEKEDVFVHVDVLRAAGLIDAEVGDAVCVVITRGAKGASALSIYPWDAARGWKLAQNGAE